jgi:hypothetical protein
MLNQILKLPFALAIALFAGVAFGQSSSTGIVHDAEYYILKAQHGDSWAKQDN